MFNSCTLFGSLTINCELSVFALQRLISLDEIAIEVIGSLLDAKQNERLNRI